MHRSDTYMGYELENSGAFVLDLETTARDGIDAILDPPTAPANYKDAEKIAAKKQEKLQASIDRAALDINLNRIVAFGTWTPAGGASVVVAKDQAQEIACLNALAETIDFRLRRRIINFNGLSFDLLVLMQRARILRVKFPILEVSPAWRSPNTDLMEVLTFGGKTVRHSLDFYCRVFDIDYDEPAEVKAVTGADIPLLVAAGRWDLVEGHCRYDVTRTGMLAQVLGQIK